MSSPRNVGSSIREGTRVVLREITASLHNSSSMQSLRRKSGNDSSPTKAPEHEVKVRFVREFADVGSVTSTTLPDSLSSASSFQSINSTASTKSSSGICADSSASSTPNQTFNESYVNCNIYGVEDLINGCANLQLKDNQEDCLYNNTFHNSEDLSQDLTFASAIEEPTADVTRDLSVGEVSLRESQNGTRSLDNSSQTREDESPKLDRTQDIQDTQDSQFVGTVCVKEPLPVAIVSSDRRNSFIKVQDIVAEPPSSEDNSDLNNSVNDLQELPVSQSQTANESNLNRTVCLLPSEENLNASSKEEEQIKKENDSDDVHALLSVNSVPSTFNSTTTIESFLTRYEDQLSLPTLPSFSSILNSADSTGLCESNETNDTNNIRKELPGSPFPEKTDIVVTVSQQIPEENSAEKVLDGSSNFIEKDICGNAVLEEQTTQETRLEETPVPKTESFRVDAEEHLPTSIKKEVDSIDTVSKDTESSVTKGDSLEVNVSSTVGQTEESKLDESLCKQSTGIDCLKQTEVIDLKVKAETEQVEEQSSEEKLDATLTFDDCSLNLESVPEVEQYTQFQPQRQSTTLATLNIQQPNFEDLKFAAEQVADDIAKSSFESSEESDCFVSAVSEVFQDPTCFDFLLKHGCSKSVNRLRTVSLYVKFDPLVGDTDMLPQGNSPVINEEQNGKCENAEPNVDTPKRSPAISAIDRLLLETRASTSMTEKTDEPQEKMANKETTAEEKKSDTPLINDVDMSKELELVRTTVLQLEEELDKQKKEYEEMLKKQKVTYQDKIDKLQTQIAQEVKSKSHITVVVEEYEKSISRLLTEREKDRATFEQEIAELQEELKTANGHLANTEAAFNDVHQKYERLKCVVSAYKSNEEVLKESIQDNLEIIRGLGARYDQLKNHAMTQLEKANLELEAMRKQHEDETVKLHAMVRKAELKSNSLSELVEQKTKENKELTQILDEVIARVGHLNPE